MLSPTTDAELRARLRRAGVRLTRQRLALARVLFDGADRHVTADSLRREAARAGTPVATGTVYNTLHCFARAGLLHEVAVDSTRSWFDTNTTPHHHFLHPETRDLEDIPVDGVSIAGIPRPPEGTRIEAVHVLVRLEKTPVKA